MGPAHRPASSCAPSRASTCCASLSSRGPSFEPCTAATTTWAGTSSRWPWRSSGASRTPEAGRYEGTQLPAEAVRLRERRRGAAPGSPANWRRCGQRLQRRSSTCRLRACSAAPSALGMLAETVAGVASWIPSRRRWQPCSARRHCLRCCALWPRWQGRPWRIRSTATTTQWRRPLGCRSSSCWCSAPSPRSTRASSRRGRPERYVRPM
mmetsp:Transcript_19340/g.53099  ORF Transcript_19340/g.53099 Transcript_19340/m.53099 type:complete len:209 (-) Transcript_19340:55-681(-)